MAGALLFQKIQEIRQFCLLKINVSILALMNKSDVLKWLALGGKILAVATSFGTIPFIPPAMAVPIFAAASILKDVINRLGDILDDGQSNGSFKSE